MNIVMYLSIGFLLIQAYGFYAIIFHSFLEGFFSLVVHYGLKLVLVLTGFFFFWRGNVYSLYSENTSNSGSWHNATIYSVILIHPCTHTFLFAIDSGSILLGVVTLAPPLFIFPPYFFSLLIGPAFHGVWLAWS